MNTQPTLKRDLGLFAAITIVVGNMIGSGVFGLPSALASVATPPVILLTWTLVGIGAMIIALSYANLSKAFPEAGGPVLYTHKAMGAFAGYAVCLVWWIAAVVGNAAIVDLIHNQLTCFLPQLNNPQAKLAIAMGFLWMFTYTNIRGVKLSGVISIITTVFKTAVLVAIVCIALPYFTTDVLVVSDEYSRQIANESSIFGMFTVAMALIFWAYIGLESSTLAGGEIKNPQRNITYSTIFGLMFVCIIYVIVSFSLMTILPPEQLAASSSPFADAINIATGTAFGGSIINAAILISVVGTLSGWILASGRSVYAAGKDKFFLPIFAKIHRRYHTPHIALIASSAITSVFVLIDYILTVTDTQGGISAFINITTVVSVISIPTFFITVIAETILLRRGTISGKRYTYIRLSIAGIVALCFMYMGVIGSQVPAVYWYATMAFFVVGLLMYPYFKKQEG